MVKYLKTFSKGTRGIALFLCAAMFFSILSFQASVAHATTPVFSDDFQDGDDVTPAWTKNGTDFSVVSDGSGNKAYKQGFGTLLRIASAGEDTWNNYSVEAKFKVDSWGTGSSVRVGIIGRMLDVDNYYLLYYDAVYKKLALEKRVSKSNVPISSTTIELNTSTYYTLKLEMNQDNVKGYVDGTLLINVTDTQFSNGKIGLRTNNQIAYFDDIHVTPYSAPSLSSNTDVTVKAGGSAYVSSIGGTQITLAIPLVTVAQLKSALLVDNGKGSIQLYEDSTKAAQTQDTEYINSGMVMVATAEDGATKKEYTFIVPQGQSNTDIQIVSGCDDFVKSVDNTLHKVSVKRLTKVVDLSTALSVDGGKGSIEIYKDPTMQTKAHPTDRVDGTMVIKSEAENKQTSQVYTITMDSSIHPVMREFYVATTGNDNNSGTMDLPYATIEKARDEIRKINTAMTGDIIVYIKGGYYGQTQPLSFGVQDSGSNGYNVIYKAYQNENPVISGGKKVASWTQVGTTGVWKASVPEISNSFKQLYVNGESRTCASTAIGIAPMSWYVENGSKKGLVFDSRLIGAFKNPSDVMIRTDLDWREFQLPVADMLNLGNGRTALIMQEPSFSKAISYSTPNFSLGSVFMIENAKELLDNKGEWYFDRTAQELFYYPLDGENMTTADVFIPVLEKLLVIDGERVDTKVKNLIFDGLTFANATWNTPLTSGWLGRNGAYYFYPTTPEVPQVQDPQGYMMAPANIQVNAAENIRFVNNVFRNLGAVGFGMYEGVKNLDIEGNVFFDIAHTGVSVGLYSHMVIDAPGEEACKYITIENNIFKNIGVDYAQGSAVEAAYVEGVRVSHNDISNVAYCGLRMGRDEFLNNSPAKNNILSYNRLENIAMKTRDAGAVYSQGAQPNSFMEYNYIVSAAGDPGGLYSDNGSAGYIIRKNVVQDTARWYLCVNGGNHDLFVTENYTNVPYILYNDSLISKNVIIANDNQIITDNNWPAEAVGIMAGAGLQNSYLGIKDKLTYVKVKNYITPTLDAIQNMHIGLYDNLNVTAPYRYTGDAGIQLALGWKVIGGPSGDMAVNEKNVFIENFRSPSTKISFNEPGTYVFKLSIGQADVEYWEKETSARRRVFVPDPAANSVTFSVTVDPVDAGEYVDVARGKTASASSQNAAYIAENAIDGDIMTGWAGNGTDKGYRWWQIDLGEEKVIKHATMVTRMDMNNDNPYTRKNIELLGSNDPSFANYEVLGFIGEEPISYLTCWEVNIPVEKPYRYYRFKKSVINEQFYIAEVRLYENVPLIYRARQVNERVHIERNVVNAKMGDYDSDNDGWALVGRTNGAGENGELVAFYIKDQVPYAVVKAYTVQMGWHYRLITPPDLAVVKKGQTRITPVLDRFTLDETVPFRQALCEHLSLPADYPILMN